MMTRQQYIEYLVSTPINYTCSNLAAHLDGVSHDAVTDFLQRSHSTARALWKQVQPLIHDNADSYLILDDSVQDKRYSTKIEMVKRQYSGAEHGLVRGIDVVNLVHSNGTDTDFYPIDYRIYAPTADGKTKNDHFRDMLIAAKADKGLKARAVLFDSWYASVANLKLVQRLDMIFVTTLKSNRLVSIAKETGYVHLHTLTWTDAHARHGQSVKLKELPFLVRLFKIVATNGDIEWVITNDPDQTRTMQMVAERSDVRWQVEQLHRELKQLTGTEKCQCRKARAQRTHISCCYAAWVSLKVKATEMKTTLYAVRTSLFERWLRAELCSPQIPAFNVV